MQFDMYKTKRIKERMCLETSTTIIIVLSNIWKIGILPKWINITD